MIEQLDGVRETVRFDSNGRVRFYHNVEQEGYPLHWHSACEVIMPLRGGYTVICQNQQIVMEQGDILWIGAGVLHQILEPEQKGERMIVLYDPRFISEFHEFSAMGPLSAPAVHISKANMSQLHGQLQDILLSTLRTEFSHGHFKYVSIYADLMKFHALVFDELLSGQMMTNPMVVGHGEEAEHTWDAGHMAIVYQSCNYIRENCRENLTLERAAEISGFSKFYFSRIFKYYTRMSFLEYLNRCRIAEAERLLADPETTVTEAAMDCGFNSISTFNRVFKVAKNCTPAEYQKLAHRSQSGPGPHGTEKYLSEFS